MIINQKKQKHIKDIEYKKYYLKIKYYEESIITAL